MCVSFIVFIDVVFEFGFELLFLSCCVVVGFDVDFGGIVLLILKNVFCCFGDVVVFVCEGILCV